MLRIVTSEIRKLNEVMKLVNMVNPHEAYLFTDMEKLCFGAIDPSHVILSYFHLNDTNYYELKGKTDRKILVPNLKGISSIFDKCKRGHVLLLNYDKSNLDLTILKENDHTILLNTSFKVEHGSDLYDFPHMKDLIQLNLDIPKLTEELGFQFLLCEDFRLKIENDDLVFVGETKKISNLEETKSPIHVVPSLKESRKVDKDMDIYLNMDFLRVIHRTLKISETGNIRIDQDLPVIFEFELRNKQGHVKYLISPKVNK